MSYRSAWRLFIAATTLLVLCGDAYRALHLVWERHEVCAAHGELVHVGEGHGGSRVTPRNGESVAPADDEAHEHDHCGARAAILGQPCLGPSAPSVLAGATTAILDGGRPEPFAARRILDMAPKQGPPSAPSFV